MELKPHVPEQPAGDKVPLSSSPSPGRFLAGHTSGRPPGLKNYVGDDTVDLNRLTRRPDPRPHEVVNVEKPWHTDAAYMFASGKFTAKAIAQRFDCAYDTVLKLLKNDWFQEKIALIQRENGAGDIMELFRAELGASLATLVELRDDTEAPASVRRATAVDILDRCLGKPTQTVVSDTTVRSDNPVEEALRLEEENKRLRDSSPSSTGAGVF